MVIDSCPMRVSLFILLAVLLSACGQKGPLFLPEPSGTENTEIEMENQDALQEKDEEATEVAE